MNTLDWNISEVISKVKEEVGAYHNFQAILEKVEQDNYLRLFFESFKRIFEEEISFAYKGELKRVGQDEAGPSS